MMLSVDGCIKRVKIYKNLEKLYNKKSWLFMTRKIGRLINSSKTRNDSKSLDELTERGLCTMFLISGDVF